MPKALPHEEPLLVVLPEDARAGEALARFIAHDAVRQYQLPSPWALDLAGVDLPATRPNMKTIDAANLEEVVDVVTRICDDRALDALVARLWREAEEVVRDFYLQRTTMQTFAAIFKMGKRTIDIDPPPEFRADRIHDNGFEVQYRIAPDDAPHQPLAPTQEGSLVYYPFDPSNTAARTEAGLGEGTSVVLEAFAYERARDRHRGVFERIGREYGWRVIDPSSPA